MATLWWRQAGFVLAIASMIRVASAEDSDLSQYFGFKPVEIFKLAEQSGN